MVLATLGLTFERFLEANAYWTMKMIDDEPARERYMRIVQGRHR